MDTTPVLMVHGLIGDLNDPAIVAAIGGPVLAPDLLGYGGLSERPQTLTLDAQVKHLHALLRKEGIERVHLVGHSLGGAIALLFARAYPELVKSILNVEGNFTLKDAFWSQRIAAMSDREFEADLEADRAEPSRWLAEAGVEVTPARLAKALHYLNHQPAATLHAMAQSVVAITAAPAYLHMAHTVCRQTPFYLIAGESSLQDWDVPPWAFELTQGVRIIRGAGHMMMLEAPLAFADTVRALTRA